MCFTYLQELQRAGNDDSVTGAEKAAARKKAICDNPMFQAVMRELEVQRARGFSVHPKMDLLKTLIIQHFAQELADDTEEGDHLARQEQWFS